MSDLPDWAFDEAREWLATQCDSKGVIPNAPSRTASLAALLLRVHLDALQPLRVEDLLAGQPRCACGVPGPEKERECHADYYDGETFAIDSGGEYGPTNVCKCGCHRLSTPEEALKVMGAGQRLVKMREIGGGK